MDEQTSKSIEGGMVYDNEQTLTALQIRLDTSKILKEFDRFLRAEKLVYDQSKYGLDGQVSVRKKDVMPKANEEGIDAIMSYLYANFNPQVVQANMSNNDYREHILEMHKRLAVMLWVNMDEWEIEDKDYTLIMMIVRDMLKLFLTRPIDNKERDSYQQFMKNVETLVSQQRGGIFPFNMKQGQ